jgi:hypothetical protein
MACVSWYSSGECAGEALAIVTRDRAIPLPKSTNARRFGANEPIGKLQAAIVAASVAVAQVCVTGGQFIAGGRKSMLQPAPKVPT